MDICFMFNMYKQLYENIYIYTSDVFIFFRFGICICIYLFPKIPYTGMYPMDVGIVNKLAH